MKDFAIIVKSEQGQVFGITGLHIMKHEAPMIGCANHWRFQLSNDHVLELIIVDQEKKKSAVLLGHWLEVLKARIRRIGLHLADV